MDCSATNGHAWFRGLRLEVGPGVFIPRLETELVAEQSIQEARRLVMSGACPSVIDLCTGTGAHGTRHDR
jgi:release factor glutamine methyltransferase